MRVEIVSVGTELLLGDVVDTNSSWLSTRLAEQGFDVYFQTKVGDNRSRIKEALEIALGRADAVVVTGGLGPTQDDITREAIADVMGVEMSRPDELVEKVAAVFRTRSRAMPESNLKQADVPEGATYIEQRTGTAPGLICPVGDKVIYALPGVPFEMEEMFERGVLPDLEGRRGAGSALVSRVVKAWGAGESTIAEMIAERVAAQTNPTIAFLAGGGEIKVRVTAKAATREEADRLATEEAEKISAALGEMAFGYDDQTLAGCVGGLARELGWKVAVAESVTGGMVASTIVDEVGASDWFAGGVVAYSPVAKANLLGVDPELIERAGVVSEEVAGAMAQGVRSTFDAEVGIATTGEAGPDPYEAEVGTVCFGISTPGGERRLKLRLPGDRPRIRLYATATALDLARRMLLAARK